LFGNLRYHLAAAIAPKDNLNPTKYYTVGDVESSLPNKVGDDQCNNCNKCEKLRSNFLINQPFTEEQGGTFFEMCQRQQEGFLPFMCHVDVATYCVILLNVLKGNTPPEDLDYKDPDMDS
jgi:hypothetical protein